MAPCSGVPSSSASDAERYDVFVSFRGEDSRFTFTSHLHQRLCDSSIRTFIDYELRKGDEISPALTRAIRGSKFSVVIFSEDYASSRWCLDELLTILDCRRTTGQLVIPVFYHIDPSIVRKQSEMYGESFKKHEERFQGRLQKWRDALTEAANLSGHHVKSDSPEAEIVMKIMEDILSHMSGLYPNKTDGLVGIERHTNEVESMLDIGSEDVLIVGIWGMGGIGKTTIAEVVYDNLSSKFQTHLFVKNVSEKENRYGLEELQCELYSTLTKGKPRDMGSYMKQRVRDKKVLIVLDDVSHTNQLETLIGVHENFGCGSRIILTSRDKHVLNCVADKIYEVDEMFRKDALHLFCLRAFKQTHPPQDYSKLSEMAVNYANCLPLAVKVLGSYFHRKNINLWKSALSKLKDIPPGDIFSKLRISYDGLDDAQKEIFLDISCYFNGESKLFINSILQRCYGMSVDWDIEVLKDKCLIHASDGHLNMHDLIAEMGCEIARQESREPEKRRRLCRPADVCQVLKKNKGSKKTELISLDVSQLEETVTLDPAVFKRLPNLRFLTFYGGSNASDKSKLHLPKGLEILPNELMSLCWEHFQLESLPSTFSWENLVHLNMSDSNIKQLSFGNQILPNLEVIDLSSSLKLTEIADFSQIPNLKAINLENCPRLLEVTSSTRMEHLQVLSLDDCFRLKEFSISGNILSIGLRGIGKDLSSMSRSKFESNCDEELFTGNSRSLVSSDEHQVSNHWEEHSFCSCCPAELSKTIHFILSLSSLRSLSLDESPIETLPASIGSCLPQLAALSVERCKYLHSLPELPQSLRVFSAHDCISLKQVSSFGTELSPATSLSVLDFSNCFRLDQNSSRRIMEFALVKVTDLNNTRGFIYFTFPERIDCLKYFPYQSEGSKLEFEDIHPTWPTTPPIGFAVAFVYHDVGPINVTYNILCNVSEVVDETTENRWTASFDIDSGSEHTVRLCRILNRGSGLSHRFKFEFMGTSRSTVVKKCGVKPLYVPSNKMRQLTEELQVCVDGDDDIRQWVTSLVLVEI